MGKQKVHYNCSIKDEMRVCILHAKYGGPALGKKTRSMFSVVDGKLLDGTLAGLPPETRGSPAVWGLQRGEVGAVAGPHWHLLRGRQAVDSRGVPSGSPASQGALLSNSYLGTGMQPGVFVLLQGQWGAVETFF